MIRFRHRMRLVYAVAAFALSWIVAHKIYQGVPTGADENSYVFQAHNFLDGRIARPYPPMPNEFDQEMIILDEKAGWLSRYPPAHSLWLTPGVALGSVYLMIALAAALGIWLVCAAATALGIAEALVAIPLLLSPYFAFMYGTQLSHTSGFAVAAAMYYCYIRWHKTDRWGWAAGAGLAWSFFFLNRTYTALLIAIPFGIDAALYLARRRDRPALRGVAAFAASAAVGVVLYLGYNQLAVGDPFTATYLYYEPSEKLGFGPRQTQGMVVHHTLANGLEYLRNNLHGLNNWLWGFKGSAIVLGALVLLGWSWRWTPLFIAAPLAVWFGYVYFWYPGVNEAGGPVYFFETLPLMMLAAGMGLQRLWNKLSRRLTLRRVIFGLATLALACASLTFAIREGKHRAGQQGIKRDLLETLQKAPPHSLVILEEFKKPHIGEIVFNPRGLDSDPLLLRSLGDDNEVIQRAFPDRTAFLLRSDTRDQLIPLPPPDRIFIHWAPTRMAHRVGRNENDRRVASAPQDIAGLLLFGKYMDLPAGSYRLIFETTARNINQDHPAVLEVATSQGKLILNSFELHGDHEDKPVTLDFVLNRPATIEPRVHFGGSGHVSIGDINIEEQDPR